MPQLNVLGIPTTHLIPNVLSSEILNGRYSHKYCVIHPEFETTFIVKEGGEIVEPQAVCCQRFQDDVLLLLEKDKKARDNQ